MKRSHALACAASYACLLALLLAAVFGPAVQHYLLRGTP